MKSYTVYVGSFKIGNVFSYNIFEATLIAVDLHGELVEVMESRSTK